MAIIHRDTDYAVRALLLLASRRDRVSVAELARVEGAPAEFLRKIMQTLRNARLVESVQGPFGGYRLAKEPGNVTLHEIIAAVQGPVVMNACFAHPQVCEGHETCPVRDILEGIARDLKDSLDNVTLDDILRSRTTHPSSAR